MFDFLSDVKKPATLQIDKSDVWLGLIPKATIHEYPVLPIHIAATMGLDKRIEMHFNRSKGKKKRFNPSRAYNDIYRAPEEANFSLTKPHTVLATLLA